MTSMPRCRRVELIGDGWYVHGRELHVIPRWASIDLMTCIGSSDIGSGQHAVDPGIYVTSHMTCLVSILD